MTYTIAGVLIAPLFLGAAAAQTPCSEGGYPLTVVAADSAALDTTYLQAMARALAYRWQIPSQHRGEYTNWQRVRHRTLPPEPRWADDWQPTTTHRAELVLTVYRNGRLRAGEVSPASGDKTFDRSLVTIATDPMPAAPALPPFPTDLSQDSVQLRLFFGQDSVPAPHGTIRFAASQTPVRPLKSGGPLSVPSGPNTPRRFAVFKYDVTETGEVRPGSFEILDASDREFERAIRDWIEGQHFQAATQNCRPVAMTVVQRAGT